jgi:hypothetical protein
MFYSFQLMNLTHLIINIIRNVVCNIRVIEDAEQNCNKFFKIVDISI